ncbi:helix-turn-helix transcriptional regulator [Halobellus rubicundus]|uniref:Helix-turn-helix transcriptional regulator n=1 Tax=Halobellus rubicundus TaxID=2996466 RepID=A0ABD5MC93_9EURY
MEALRDDRLIAATVFVVATLVLTVQFLTPSPVVVSVGDGGATTTELGSYYTREDAALLAIAACLFGAAGTYLFASLRSDPATGENEADAQPEPETSNPGSESERESESAREDTRRDEWAATADRLAGTEETVYRTVLEAEGELPQAEVVERTDLSKATVSRVLDSLERRDLVDRRRRGLGNVVRLR